MMTDLFPDIVGLESVKKKLTFLIENYHRTNIMPHLAFIASQGCGKTFISKKIASYLTVKGSTKPKKFLEVNCATIKTKKALFDDVIDPFLVDSDVTVLWDEAGVLTDEVSTVFLTILNDSPFNVNQLVFNGRTYVFDFSRLTFIFATTNPESVIGPLMDRLEKITFEEYNTNDLAKILCNSLQKFEIESGLLENIAPYVRANPRAARKLASHIRAYLVAKNLGRFTLKDWEEIRDRLSIKPLGLETEEIKLMRVLAKCPNSSLTRLAASLGLAAETVRRHFELYLLRNNIISINKSGRNLTDFGRKLLKEIDGH